MVSLTAIQHPSMPQQQQPWDIFISLVYCRKNILPPCYSSIFETQPIMHMQRRPDPTMNGTATDERQRKKDGMSGSGWGHQRKTGMLYICDGSQIVAWKVSHCLHRDCSASCYSPPCPLYSLILYCILSTYTNNIQLIFLHIFITYGSDVLQLKHQANTIS